MSAPNTTWYPLTTSARVYSGPPRGYAGFSGAGLGSYTKWVDPPISTDYIGPIHRYSGRTSIYATKALPWAWSSPYVDPTSELQHYGEGGGVGPVVGMSGMGSFMSEVGGVAIRLGGVGLGWVVGKSMLKPFVGETGGGVVGAVLGYAIGVGVSKLGGE